MKHISLLVLSPNVIVSFLVFSKLHVTRVASPGFNVIGRSSACWSSKL
jgi:hypothetical protein